MTMGHFFSIFGFLPISGFLLLLCEGASAKERAVSKGSLDLPVGN